MAPAPPRLPHPAFFGLALITVGLLFLLRELGALPSIGFWTLVLLAVGGWLLVGTVAGRRHGWFLPLALLAVGVFKLLQDLGTIRRFSLWPVVLIALGVSMLAEASTFRRRHGDSPAGSDRGSWRDL